uniref:Myoneurin n=1 Tax=Phallusia mammillata TaxID=59560 RepID=A0A6F9DL18_9ASCI|nr:myoneurin [Phallusia mammillata]
MIYASQDYCLSKMLNEMRRNNEYCDIALGVNDIEFAAHKAVLVAASQYMRQHLATLHGDLLELQMQLSNADVFEDILQFMYTGEISLTKDNFAEISMVASHLQISAFKSAAVQFLKSTHDIRVSDISSLAEPSMEVTVPDDYAEFESFDETDYDVNNSQPAVKKQKQESKKPAKPLSRNSSLMVIDQISKRYKCSLCGKSFARKQGCLSHCRRHCVCSICGKAFDTEQSLKGHIKSKTCVVSENKSAVSTNASVFLTKDDIVNDFRFKCDACYTMFQIFETFQEHRLTAHNIEELLTCIICRESFDTGDSLSSHIKHHYLSNEDSSDSESEKEGITEPASTSKFTCRICGAKFNEPGAYNNHLLAQCKTSGLPCPVCHKLFSCKPSLQRHLEKRTRQVQCGVQLEKNQLHTISSEKNVDNTTNNSKSVYGFICKACDLGFEKFSEFASHRGEQHGAKEEMKCRFCGLVFGKEIWIDKHVQYHVQEVSGQSNIVPKSYKCHICDLEYETEYEFECHRTDSCTDECRFCGKVFKSRAQLRTHVYTHLRKNKVKPLKE